MQKKEAKSLSKSSEQKLQSMYTPKAVILGSESKQKTPTSTKKETRFRFKDFVHRISFGFTKIEKKQRLSPNPEKSLGKPNLAFVDKMAKTTSGIKFLLVLQD